MTPSDTQNESETAKANDENSRDLDSFLGFFLFFLFSLAIVLVGIFTSWLFDKNYSFFLWCLFFIPIVIHGIGWRALHQNRPKPENKKSIINAEVSEKDKELIGLDKFCGFYNITMVVSVVLFCIAWIGYNNSDCFDVGLWRWSLFCILGIIIQLGIVCYVTYTIMEISHKRSKYTLFLKSGLESAPFWRFAHFFAIFMSISFLFGFAFAFHDLEYRKIHKKPALLVENLASDERIEEEKMKKSNPTQTPPPASTPSPTPTQTQTASDEVLNPEEHPTLDKFNPKPFCFYFDSNKANIISEKRERGVFKPTTDDDSLKFTRFKKNHLSLEELIYQINKNKSEGIVRLTLIGSADDKPIPSNDKKKDKKVQPADKVKDNEYPSNYDLSEARIQATKNEISKKLYEKTNGEWQKIDWITIAHSNEEYSNQSKDLNNPTETCSNILYKKVIENHTQNENDKILIEEEPDSGKRTVTVYLSVISSEVQDKKPNLMDYMYFSIYTITTTGYGDIKPATRYTKFLVSLENFFEVFFLVCFMNTLIALKSEPKMSSKSLSD